MNSKERVQAAFPGSDYDRLPMWFGAEPDTTKNVMKLLEAKRNSVQVKKIQKSAVATMPGKATGRTTRKIHVARVPPSINTDSPISCGTSSKKPFIIQMTNGSWIIT